MLRRRHTAAGSGLRSDYPRLRRPSRSHADLARPLDDLPRLAGALPGAAARARGGASPGTRPRDGIRLAGAFFPPPAPDRPVVLYFHGNAEAAAQNLPFAASLRARGLGVFLAEYRGYGGLGGSPSEKGLYADGEAALAELGRLGVPTARVVLVGRSLGSGVAVELATRHTVAAVVLVSAYTSIVDMGRTVAGPLAPLVIRDRFDSLSKIARVASPVVLLHGTRDDVVPVEMGRRLAAARPGARYGRGARGDAQRLPGARGAPRPRDREASSHRPALVRAAVPRARTPPRATIRAAWARSRRLPDSLAPPLTRSSAAVSASSPRVGPRGGSPSSRSEPSRPSSTSAGPATFPTSPCASATAGGTASGSSAAPIHCTGASGCLVVYVAPWCGPCRSSLPGDVALADHIRTKGYETVFVVGMDETEACLEMTKSIGRPARLDADGKWAKAAGVRGVPHFLVTTPTGKIRKRQAGAYMAPPEQVAELLGIS